MKRFFSWFFILLALFGLIFFGLNLFDARPAPGSLQPVPTGEDKLPAASLEAGNGFFLLWGFAAAAENDLLAPAFRVQVLELIDSMDKKSPARWRYSRWLANMNAGFRQNWQGANLYFPQLPGDDVCAYFASRRAQINEQLRRYAVPLGRYRQLLQAADIGDFTPLGWDFPGRSFLLAAFTAKLFAASRALAALDNDWQGPCDDLFAALATGLKLIACGRTLTVNSLGKTMVDLSLRTLASLLNRGECPQAVVRFIIERLPSRPVNEFGTAAARAFAWMGFARALERIKSDQVVDPFLLKDYFREPAGFFALERFVAISGPRFFTAVHALAAFFLKKMKALRRCVLFGRRSDGWRKRLPCFGVQVRTPRRALAPAWNSAPSGGCATRWAK